MLKRRWLTALIVVLILASFGCQRNLEPGRQEQDIYVGTKGLDIKLIKDLPPSKVFDTSAINILAELKNQGTSDISGGKCYAHLSGYDESIIRGLDKEKFCGSNLFGKSRVFPEGGLDTVEFNTDLIQLPTGVDSLSQKFILTSCYDYETIASPVVCIDPGLFKIKSIQDACTVRDVTLGGGQGAPVAVSRVDVDMLGADKVGFRIHISNVGGGQVLRNGVSLSGRGSNSCPFNLDYDDYNIIDYSIQMSGGNMISCSPEHIRLVNDKASVFCKFDVPGNNAYTTPLQIKLNYAYLDSISKTVEIIKTPE